MPISSNAARAYVYFVSKGFSPSAAAGLVGHLMRESGPNLNTGAYNPNDPGGSYGVMQANRDRKAALMAYKDPTARDELERQLSYILHEMSGREARAGKMFRGAQDLNSAIRAGFAYERPADQAPGGKNWNKSLNYASAVYRDQTGQNPTLGSAPSASGGMGAAGGGPPAPPPPPPDYAGMNLDAAISALTGQPSNPVDQVAAQPPPPAPAPEAPPTPPEPTQGSAASLMATLLDTKRAERTGLPFGLLDRGYA